MMSWLVVILFLVFLIYLYKLCYPPANLWKYGNLIPGPKPLPIVGNALMFLFSKSKLQTLRSTVHNYGPLSRLWMGNRLSVLLTDPEDMEVFFASNDHIEKSDLYRLVDSWIGRSNLVSADINIWKVHRKVLTPSFHFKILENAVGMIKKHGNILCQQLESEVGQSEFDTIHYIEKFSLDVISETAMGIDLQCQTTQHSQYMNNVKIIEASVMNRFVSPWLFPEIIFRISNSGRRYYKALKEMKPFVRKVIMDRKAILANEKSLSNLTYDEWQRQIQELSVQDFVNKLSSDTKNPKPFLDFLLLESNFSNQEIEDEVQTVMVAGHDTVTTGLTFCLYALSSNPQVQEKLIQEIDDTITQKGDCLSLHDYNNMKYMSNVIKETLRMYTPVPLIRRKVTKDIKLSSGFTLPAGCDAILFLWFLHNNEKFFEEPEKFKPERFDNREQKNSYDFVPFSAGSRNCIGQKFGNLEMKVALFKIFQKYRLLPAIKQTTIELDAALSLYSKQGLPIRIVRRS